VEDWTIVGIDPAPTKPAVTCTDGTDFQEIAASDLAACVSDLLKKNNRVLIAWDAPLSFDPKNGYSDRPVDRKVRAWVKAQGERISPKAVSVLPFSGCSHWAISCGVLGMPFGEGPAGLQLAQRPQDGDKLVVEVHPAVTLALWWVAHVEGEPMPKYKGVKKGEMETAIEAIRSRLSEIGIPDQAGKNDDYLDAWVAWKMGRDFVDGRAAWVGSPDEGGYVLPATEAGSLLR